MSISPPALFTHRNLCAKSSSNLIFASRRSPDPDDYAPDSQVEKSHNDNSTWISIAIGLIVGLPIMLAPLLSLFRAERCLREQLKSHFRLSGNSLGKPIQGTNEKIMQAYKNLYPGEHSKNILCLHLLKFGNDQSHSLWLPGKVDDLDIFFKVENNTVTNQFICLFPKNKDSDASKQKLERQFGMQYSETVSGSHATDSLRLSDELLLAFDNSSGTIKAQLNTNKQALLRNVFTLQNLGKAIFPFNQFSKHDPITPSEYGKKA